MIYACKVILKWFQALCNRQTGLTGLRSRDTPRSRKVNGCIPIYIAQWLLFPQHAPYSGCMQVGGWVHTIYPYQGCI